MIELILFLLAGCLNGFFKALADTLAHHKRIDIFEDKSGFWSWDSKDYVFLGFNFNVGHLASDARTVLVVVGFAFGGLLLQIQGVWFYAALIGWWLCHYGTFRLFYDGLFIDYDKKYGKSK